jgi:hypothetical protein
MENVARLIVIDTVSVLNSSYKAALRFQPSFK